VAPYEADAQMAYMVQTGLADFAITEDSDLIAYGCPRVVMKLSPLGQCQEFSFKAFHSFIPQANQKDVCVKEIETMQKMSKQDFVMACVMAGCEYLPNIERVGLKVALKHFKQHGSFAKVVQHLLS
jgi:exonuclease-1